MDPQSLRAVTFLRDLNEEELAAFASLLTPRKCQARERIIEEGTPVTALYIIADGVVHVRRLAQKRITAAGSAKSRAGAGITKQLFSSVAWQQDREAAVLKKIRSKTPRRAKTAPARVRNA